MAVVVLTPGAWAQVDGDTWTRQVQRGGIVSAAWLIRRVGNDWRILIAHQYALPVGREHALSPAAAMREANGILDMAGYTLA